MINEEVKRETVVYEDTDSPDLAGLFGNLSKGLTDIATANREISKAFIDYNTHIADGITMYSHFVNNQEVKNKRDEEYFLLKEINRMETELDRKSLNMEEFEEVKQIEMSIQDIRTVLYICQNELSLNAIKSTAVATQENPLKLIQRVLLNGISILPNGFFVRNATQYFRLWTDVLNNPIGKIVEGRHKPYEKIKTVYLDLVDGQHLMCFDFLGTNVTFDNYFGTVDSYPMYLSKCKELSSGDDRYYHQLALLQTNNIDGETAKRILYEINKALNKILISSEKQLLEIKEFEQFIDTINLDIRLMNLRKRYQKLITLN